MSKKLVFLALLLGLFAVSHTKAFAYSYSQPLIVDHNSANEFNQIPTQYLNAAKSQFRIWYAHTSHGSQITTGMDILNDTLGSLYGYNTTFYYEVRDDLGEWGDSSWVNVTRQQLDSGGSDKNVVIWAWCTGAQKSTLSQIQSYLDNMNQLEEDYPNVHFVYMTGHMYAPEVGGSLETLIENNNLIRQYALANNKILFDFADIESYDPLGNYYSDSSDQCEWCYNWCSSNPCPSQDPYYQLDSGEWITCQHSHTFNCLRKSHAFWWMMARLAGWGSGSVTTPTPTNTPTPTQTQRCDINSNGLVEIGDISAVLYFWGDACTGSEQACVADANQNGSVEIGDISAVIFEWGNSY